jgi:HlyD family type I secretion membrane fusion protein
MRSLPRADQINLAGTLPRVHASLRMRGAVLLGLSAIVVAFGGFGFWAATAQLASAVVASGKVIVATKRKLIQHLDGGIVSAINAKDGDLVVAGDVLFELDITKPRSRGAMSRAAYLGGLAAAARLSTERDGQRTIHFPPELLAEMRADPEIAALVANQQQILEARLLERTGQTDILRQRIDRLRQEISGLEAERAAAVQQLELANSELATLEMLLAQGYTTRPRVLAIKREGMQLQGQLGRLGAQMARAEKEIGETELNLLQISKKLNAEILGELKEAQAKVLEHREQYVASRSELERTAIRAPVSGAVFGSQLHTVGGVVRGGDTLLEIVPTHDHLIVEVRLRPQDVDEVVVGQRTDVRISAFKQRTTPSLTGRVSHVSADVLNEPKIPEAFYVAHIEIEARELERLGGLKLQPGMPAEVMIKTGERTPLAYLMQPLRDSINLAWREQ